MINSILNNQASLILRNNFTSSNKKMSVSLQRMSSGLKINCAKDNAADSTILTKTAVKLSGIEVANNNSQQAGNFLNTASSTLDNMSQKANRIRELALQSLNETYGIQEKQAMQDEVNELIAEINREKSSAVYSNMKIFEPVIVEKPYLHEVEYVENAYGGYIDTGIMGNENIRIECDLEFVGSQTAYNFNGARQEVSGSKGALTLVSYSSSGKVGFFVNGMSIPAINYDNNRHSYAFGNGEAIVDGVSYGDTSTTEFSTNHNIALFGCNGAGQTVPVRQKLYSTKIYDDGKLIKDYIPVVDNNGVACLYDKVGKEFLYNSNGAGFEAGDEKIEPVPTSKEFSFHIGADAGIDNTLDVEINIDFGILQGNVLNLENASKLLRAVDEFNENIYKEQSKIASNINRLESICQLQENEIESLNMRKSIIGDCDIASESMNFVQEEIRTQFTSSLFSQANSINGNLALRLLNVT